MLSQLSYEVAALNMSLQIDFLGKAPMFRPFRIGDLRFSEQLKANEEE
jgi:hypothetical protein